MKRIFLAWAPFLFLITFITFVAYASVQQILRMNANDPQIQLAEDNESKIEDLNASPQTVVGPPVDISKSLSPFIVIYDEHETAVASSALLGGSIPVPPAGVFTYLRSNKEDRFTWEPQAGIRTAVVMRRIEGSHSGFILVGRSLREIEKRENNMKSMLVWSLIGGLFLTLLYSIYITRYSR